MTGVPLSQVQPPSPETPEFRPERETHQYRSPPEARQGYRPAAPIQRFNNKSLNWPAWFRHFRAVADVHGWSKEQRALQLVSYLDETAMNVAQELGDNDLYNYDVRVKLLRVSAFRSRFHGRSRRHHEDADAFADALAELCRVGYPQSPPELRQELIAEQFVRGQLDPELKKYLWVVIRTQKDRKLQMLIEVCTDFSSLVTPTHLHRPAEQIFAVHHHSESYTEEDEELEDVFAIGDRPSWNNNRRSPDTSTSPNLQQMFTLAHRMGYEMRPIARQPDFQRWPPGNRPPTDHNRGFRPQTRTNRDYSRIKCFSCGEFGHMQTAAQHRILHFPSSRQAGIYSPITDHSATGTITRETLHRPGPHRSVCTSFDPPVIFMHHTDLIRSVTGNQYHTYSTTNEVMYGNMRVSQEAKEYGITGGIFKGRRGSSIISQHGPNTRDDTSSWQVSRLVCHDGQSGHGWRHYANIGRRSLVPGRMDRWPRCGLSSGFWIRSDRRVTVFL